MYCLSLISQQYQIERLWTHSYYWTLYWCLLSSHSMVFPESYGFSLLKIAHRAYLPIYTF